jgi:hypothetical protein
VLPATFEAGNYASRATPPSPGSVLEPAAGGRGVRGGWKRRRRELAAALADGVVAGGRAMMGRPKS